MKHGQKIRKQQVSEFFEQFSDCGLPQFKPGYQKNFLKLFSQTFYDDFENFQTDLFEGE